jgi:uncharacterized protein YwlG (UPF0340 family)
MSNLSKETEKQISDRGEKLTENLKTDNPFNTGYVQGFIDGHESGATEWAERAQGLVDALKEAKKKLNILHNSDAIEIITSALAKYREVSK